MQTYLNQREVLFKKTTNMILDQRVNQHQHMIYYHQQPNEIIIDILHFNTKFSRS